MEHTTIFYSSLSLLILLITFTKFLRFHQPTRRQNLPPSPPSLPILGHLHLLKPPIHRLLHKLSKTHGPIFTLRFGSRLVLVVTSASLADEYFTKNDIVFANRPKLLMGKHFSYNYTTLVQAPFGDHWRNLRRLMSIEVFSSNRLNSLSSIRTDEIRRLVKNLMARGAHGGFCRVELKAMFSELMYNIMMRMVAGKRYFGDDVENEEEATRFRGMVKEAVKYVGTSNPGDFLPVLNWIDGGRFVKKVKNISNKADEFLQGLIDEQRKKSDSERSDTMIGHLLSLQESEPEYYTDQIIKGIMLVMFVAGTDTISVTLEWAMSNLLNHPQALQKAKTEIDLNLGQQTLVDESNIHNLQHLQHIISETLRLHPAAPLLVPHFSSTNCNVGGYDIPSNTILLVNVWAIHRDPKLWDEPNSFKPERFEKDDIRKVMAFGLGRRSCPGAGLAQRVMGSTLGLLIQCFEWKRIGEEKVDMKEGKGITMPRVEPLDVLCKARSITKEGTLFSV